MGDRDEPGRNGRGSNGHDGGSHCRFVLSPPRHFWYPAVLLLLAEEPRHGYRLVDALLRLGFGPVDRATIYRTLADLEHDGLVSSWDAVPVAGSIRHVYAPTERGREALATWMQVVRDERDRLGATVARWEALTDGGRGSVRETCSGFVRDAGSPAEAAEHPGSVQNPPIATSRGRA